MFCPNCSDYLPADSNEMIKHLLECGFTLQQIHDNMISIGLITQREFDEYIERAKNSPTQSETKRIRKHHR